MPLIKLESINPDCKWGLWEITETYEELKSLIDLSGEAGNIELIKNELKKREKTAGRVLLKKIIESWDEIYQGTDCDIHGKPYLREKSYHISLSHSHGQTVAIVNKNDKIGIDIELIKEKIANIAPRVFTSEEAGSDMANIPKLITLWCVKESLYKLYGERGLDFKKNIRVLPFEYHEAGGICQGQVVTENSLFQFNLRYLKYKGFIITYILN